MKKKASELSHLHLHINKLLFILNTISSENKKKGKWEKLYSTFLLSKTLPSPLLAKILTSVLYVLKYTQLVS